MDGDLGPQVEEAAAKGWSSFQRHLQGGLSIGLQFCTQMSFSGMLSGDAMNLYVLMILMVFFFLEKFSDMFSAVFPLYAPPGRL